MKSFPFGTAAQVMKRGRGVGQIKTKSCHIGGEKRMTVFVGLHAMRKSFPVEETAMGLVYR